MQPPARTTTQPRPPVARGRRACRRERFRLVVVVTALSAGSGTTAQDHAFCSRRGLQVVATAFPGRREGGLWLAWSGRRQLGHLRQGAGRGDQAPSLDRAPGRRARARLVAGRETDRFRACSEAGGAIDTVPSLGGQERRLTDISGLVRWSGLVVPALSWSPDGKWLAFGEKPSEGKASRIVRVSLETREKQPLTSPPEDTQGDLHPSFSPDGTLLAFCRSGSGTYGDWDVWVQRVGEGTPRRLTHGEYDVCHDPVWTSAGSEILFTTGWTDQHPSSERGGGRAPAGLRPGRGLSVHPREPHGVPTGHLQPQAIWRVGGRRACDAQSGAAEADRLQSGRKQRRLLPRRPEDRFRVHPKWREQYLGLRQRRDERGPTDDLRGQHGNAPLVARRPPSWSSTRSRRGTGTSMSSTPMEGRRRG